MTDKQINAAIAKTCGWKPHRRSWKLSKGKNGHVVDYFDTKEAAEEYLQICRRNTADWLNEVEVFEVPIKPPYYCDNLNLMHQVEQKLWKEDCNARYDFVFHLGKILMPTIGYRAEAVDLLDATARQRAEAFLRTLGKWEEGK